MLQRRSEPWLLLGAAACLLFGGGVGCDPELAGVDFRATSVLSDPNDRFSPRDWYMAFNGKKAPGNGSAELPYELTPPFGVSARMGVFVQDSVADSLGSEGCIGLRNTGAAEQVRLCVRQDPGVLVIDTSLDSSSATCPGATRAELDLDDDGMNVVARYRCPGLAFVPLTSAASDFDAGEEWNAFVAAEGLVKGGQVAFDDFRVVSEDPSAAPGSAADIAFQTFEAFRLGVEAVYSIEDEEPGEAGGFAGEASGKLGFAAANSSNPAAQKLLGKAASSLEKLLLSTAKYQKGFVKVAGVIASALSTLDSDF